MRFGYLKDPLFLFCLVLYFVNRWVLKPHFPNVISRNYLNDLICLPFWIPIMLLLMRKIGLRRNDSPPQGSEIVVPLLLWSWVFEEYLPRTDFFRGLSFSDYLDILSYTTGACFAAVFWKFWYREHRVSARNKQICHESIDEMSCSQSSPRDERAL